MTRSSTYLPSGQLSNDGTRAFGYDDAGRLTSVDGGSSATYVHNALGQRVKKVTPVGTTYFVYDEAGQEIPL